MTRDELIIHWRELLSVPDDAGDALTRQWCRAAAAVLIELAMPNANTLATPHSSEPRSSQQTPPEWEDSTRLEEAKRASAALDAGRRSGELVEKADVVSAIDRGLVAALNVVRQETQQVSAQLQAGSWSDAGIDAWWTGVTDRALGRYYGELALVLKSPQGPPS